MSFSKLMNPSPSTSCRSFYISYLHLYPDQSSTWPSNSVILLLSSRISTTRSFSHCRVSYVSVGHSMSPRHQFLGYRMDPHLFPMMASTDDVPRLLVHFLVACRIPQLRFRTPGKSCPRGGVSGFLFGELGDDTEES